MNMDKEKKMPRPATVDYDIRFRLTDRFMKDIHTVCDGLPYADVKILLDSVDNCGGVMYIAAANELIQRLSRLPYRNVKDLMRNIENSQDIYLVKID